MLDLNADFQSLASYGDKQYTCTLEIAGKPVWNADIWACTHTQIGGGLKIKVESQAVQKLEWKQMEDEHDQI